MRRQAVTLPWKILLLFFSFLLCLCFSVSKITKHYLAFFRETCLTGAAWAKENPLNLRSNQFKIW